MEKNINEILNRLQADIAVSFGDINYLAGKHIKTISELNHENAVLEQKIHDLEKKLKYIEQSLINQVKP